MLRRFRLFRREDFPSGPEIFPLGGRQQGETIRLAGLFVSQKGLIEELGRLCVEIPKGQQQQDLTSPEV